MAEAAPPEKSPNVEILSPKTDMVFPVNGLDFSGVSADRVRESVGIITTSTRKNAVIHFFSPFIKNIVYLCFDYNIFLYTCKCGRKNSAKK